MRGYQIDLSHYRSMQEYNAQIGDVLFYHGWLTHWFGIVSAVNNSDGIIEVIRAGMPLLLVTLGGSKLEKAKKKIDINDLKNSRGGKYSAIKNIKNVMVWYV